MFSVIIPTMWKSPILLKILDFLVDNPLVGEIIVIDNDYVNRLNVVDNKKIKIFCSYENIYVNPAWNLGFKVANYNNLCFLTDTTVIDLRCLYELDCYINKNIGVVGIDYNPGVSSSGLYYITNINNEVSVNNFFRCFFMTKDSYIEIPKELKLYFGDNYIWDSCLWNNKEIHIIKDMFCYSIGGITTGTNPTSLDMYTKDKEEYKKILISKGLIPEIWCPTHFR